MIDRQTLLHDLNVIEHLSERIDTDDKEQVRAVLLIQKKDHLLQSDYGKRFIGRLIGIFTDKKVPKTDIFTGEPLEGSFPVSEKVLTIIRKDPEAFVHYLEKKEAKDALERHRQEAAADVAKLASDTKTEIKEPVHVNVDKPLRAQQKASTQKPQAQPEVKEERPKATPYQLEEIRFREREEAAARENERAMREKAELEEAQKKLDREEARYQAVKDTAHKAVDAANEISDRVYKFSKAEEGEGNNPTDLLSDIEKPWKYWKIYWKIFLLFLLFGYWFIMTKSAGAMVPEMILGAGMIPVAAFLFIDEITEIYEDRMKVHSAILCTAFGLILSLLLTWITGNTFTTIPVLNAAFSAVLDEAVIFLVMFALILRHIKKNGHNATVLQGIWYGAAFGVGFSFYQICQMALSNYFNDQRPGVFMWQLFSQSLLSTGGHIAWTCICGGALSVIVTEAGVIRSAEFTKMCSTALILPIVLQMLWDLPYLDFGLYGFSLKKIVVMLISLWVVNIFLHRGIREAISAHQESSHKTEETHA